MTSVLELEAEVAATRERLNSTIGRIQDKLTVSGMVDEFMGQAGVPKLDSGHDYVLGLLRRHPVPVMVAAAGIGFLIYQMSKGAGSRKSFPVLDDGDLVDVPALNNGQSRIYDPDRPSRHPLADGTDERRIEA